MCRRCCRPIEIREHQSIVHGVMFEVVGVPRLVSPDDFEKAPMYTVFKGPAEDTGIGAGWDLFSIDGGRIAGEEVMVEAARRGIAVALDDCGMMLEPQWDADVIDSDEHPELADDFKAACAYLNSGGRLVKLPDTMDSKYFRLYPVVHVREHGREEEST